MMTAQSKTRTSPADTSHTLKRRGLLAAAAAFVAGLVAKVAETPVAAGSDGDVVLGGGNTTSGVTEIINTGFGVQATALELFSVNDTFSEGLFSYASSIGVSGASQGQGNGIGVAGYSSGASSTGVFGDSDTGVGVRGHCETSTGVLGLSTSGVPVFGQVAAGSSANTIAIYAQNYSTFAGPGPGAGGFGIYGISAKGHGLVGATATAGGAAVVGATNGVAGAYAGAFYGRVIVSGDFTVAGGAKSAAVPHPDGSHRRLYCMESPESWFEDFGTGQLQCGRADVAIDPDFAALVDLTGYHVFLTQYDQHNDLCVADRRSTGFRVEAKNGSGDGQFSWRVVAKRKDITAERLAAVTIPSEPPLPPSPKVPPLVPRKREPR
jgi:hypothetical protein